MTTTAVPVATRASGFTSYDPAFQAVTGRDPVLAKVLDVEAHEGPVYLAGEDALYFTTLPRRRREAGLDVPLVDIRKLALDGYRFPLEPERVSVVRPQANAANGMTLAPDGSLLVCEQGSWFQPARITGSTRTRGPRSRWSTAQRRAGSTHPTTSWSAATGPCGSPTPPTGSCSTSGPGRSRRTPSTATTRPAAR